MNKLKLVGTALGAFAGACLLTHRTRLRREGSTAANASNRDHRSDNAATPPRQRETRTDAGGQTA
ncbi:MAG TPA: hypothetical protein VJ743_24100 [Albitalea sp.]|nr:hypothetical protein [Albitalea sp.]